MAKGFASKLKDFTRYELTDPGMFKHKAVEWSRRFEQVCCLDHNHYPADPFHSFDWALAVTNEHPDTNRSVSFSSWKAEVLQRPDWMFGMLSYELKNETEQLVSQNEDRVAFPSLHFFYPAELLFIIGSTLFIRGKKVNADLVFSAIETLNISGFSKAIAKDLDIQSRISKQDYLDTVRKVQHHILEGDIYELNFCQEFFLENCVADPYQLWLKMNSIGQAPFSAFYKWKDRYLLCASPERFLAKRGQKLISQPIKGTRPRSPIAEVDLQLKNELASSVKDRAENVMIVDLVRNDLARSCETGTIKVDELFGIYSFRQVHQMISSVSGRLREDIHFTDAIKAAFPMGSMTGAPKIRAMQLIDEFESTARGLYSGSVGYITPDQDFDFNVVIRSILYREKQQYLSYQVGGAIVYDSDPETEFQECLVKAKTMIKTLGHSFDAQ